MLNHRLSACAVLTMGSLLVACGHSYHDARVRVLDGETLEPIQGVTVRPEHAHAKSFMLFGPNSDPKPKPGTTDAGGVATVRVSANHTTVCHVDAGGAFYLWQGGPHEPSDSPGLRWFASTEQALPRPLDLSAERTHDVMVYRMPGPFVRVHVPNGYRGPLVVGVPPYGREAGQPGRREFDVTPNGSGAGFAPSHPALNVPGSWMTWDFLDTQRRSIPHVQRPKWRPDWIDQRTNAVWRLPGVVWTSRGSLLDDTVNSTLAFTTGNVLGVRTGDTRVLYQTELHVFYMGTHGEAVSFVNSFDTKQAYNEDVRVRAASGWPYSSSK